MKVKVRQVTGRVDRAYADEFLRKAKFRRSDSRFYCEDCGHTSHPGFCKFVAEHIGDSSEYCTYFEPKSEVENSGLLII